MCVARVTSAIQYLPDQEEAARKPAGQLRRFVALPGGHILGIAVLFVRVGWAFGMVRGIFDAFYGRGFDGLICVRELFDRFFIRVAGFGEPLRTHALTGTVDADVRGIISEFIQLGFQVAFQLGRALIGLKPVAALGIFVGVHARFITPRR